MGLFKLCRLFPDNECLVQSLQCFLRGEDSELFKRVANSKWNGILSVRQGSTNCGHKSSGSSRTMTREQPATGPQTERLLVQFRVAEDVSSGQQWDHSALCLTATTRNTDSLSVLTYLATTKQSINQSTNQPTDPPTNQPTNQPIKQTINWCNK